MHGALALRESRMRFKEVSAGLPRKSVRHVTVSLVHLGRKRSRQRLPRSALQAGGLGAHELKLPRLRGHGIGRHLTNPLLHSFQSLLGN
jgi:hypothetical protein